MANNYWIGPRIGRGGMADVFLAVRLGAAGFAKLCVVKRARGDVTCRQAVLRTLFDEACVLARLSHPNIVQVTEIDEDTSGPLVAMEYLAGESLLTILGERAARGAALPWPLVCRLGADLAAGLGAAHQARDTSGRAAPVVHRDLSPSNVIVCYSGQVKLIDFGIAKPQGTGDTRVGAIKGKISYLAPELLRGEQACPRTDLFQLGVVLHEALCGRRLFGADNDAGRVRAVLEREVPPLAIEGAPPELLHGVTQLLSRDPAARPSGAEQVRMVCERALLRWDRPMAPADLGTWLRDEMPARHAAMEERDRQCLNASCQRAPDAATIQRRVASHVAGATTDVDVPSMEIEIVGLVGDDPSATLGEGSDRDESLTEPLPGTAPRLFPKRPGAACAEEMTAAGAGPAPPDRRCGVWPVVRSPSGKRPGPSWRPPALSPIAQALVATLVTDVGDDRLHGSRAHRAPAVTLVSPQASRPAPILPAMHRRATASGRRAGVWPKLLVALCAIGVILAISALCCASPRPRPSLYRPLCPADPNAPITPSIAHLVSLEPAADRALGAALDVALDAIGSTAQLALSLFPNFDPPTATPPSLGRALRSSPTDP